MFGKERHLMCRRRNHAVSHEAAIILARLMTTSNFLSSQAIVLTAFLSLSVMKIMHRRIAPTGRRLVGAALKYVYCPSLKPGVETDRVARSQPTHKITK